MFKVKPEGVSSLPVLSQAAKAASAPSARHKIIINAKTFFLIILPGFTAYVAQAYFSNMIPKYLIFFNLIIVYFITFYVK